jgi:hypothetical protein
VETDGGLTLWKLGAIGHNHNRMGWNIEHIPGKKNEVLEASLETCLEACSEVVVCLVSRHWSSRPASFVSCVWNHQPETHIFSFYKRGWRYARCDSLGFDMAKTCTTSSFKWKQAFVSSDVEETLCIRFSPANYFCPC